MALNCLTFSDTCNIVQLHLHSDCFNTLPQWRHNTFTPSMRPFVSLLLNVFFNCLFVLYLRAERNQNPLDKTSRCQLMGSPWWPGVCERWMLTFPTISVIFQPLRVTGCPSSPHKSWHLRWPNCQLLWAFLETNRNGNPVLQLWVGCKGAQLEEVQWLLIM